MPRPAKDPEAQAKIRAAAASGAYVITAHARSRMAQRAVTLVEVVDILATGHREASHDRYSAPLRSWTYAQRGRTPEARELRVVVAIQGLVAVVTVIDLARRGDHED